MYAHGSCLYVDDESKLLFVVLIPLLHTQRCIPVFKSVPESQSNGILVLRVLESQSNGISVLRVPAR